VWRSAARGRMNLEKSVIGIIGFDKKKHLELPGILRFL
jgi:hypothetical protein